MTGWNGGVFSVVMFCSVIISCWTVCADVVRIMSTLLCLMAACREFYTTELDRTCWTVCVDVVKIMSTLLCLMAACREFYTAELDRTCWTVCVDVVKIMSTLLRLMAACREFYTAELDRTCHVLDDVRLSTVVDQSQDEERVWRTRKAIVRSAVSSTTT